MPTEDLGVPPENACFQRSVVKFASLMVRGCITAYGMGSLHICMHQIIEAYAPIHTSSFSVEALIVST